MAEMKTSLDKCSICNKDSSCCNIECFCCKCECNKRVCMVCKYGKCEFCDLYQEMTCNICNKGSCSMDSDFVYFCPYCESGTCDDCLEKKWKQCECGSQEGCMICGNCAEMNPNKCKKVGSTKPLYMDEQLSSLRLELAILQEKVRWCKYHYVANYIDPTLSVITDD